MIKGYYTPDLGVEYYQTNQFNVVDKKGNRKARFTIKSCWQDAYLSICLAVARNSKIHRTHGTLEIMGIYFFSHPGKPVLCVGAFH